MSENAQRSPSLSAAQAAPPPRRVSVGAGQRVRVLSFTSGKGGVGKTCIAVNMAYWLAKLGNRVLLLDADLGLANVDVVLGLRPACTLEHVLSGEKTLSDILLDGPGGIRILPAGSGVAEMADLDEGSRVRLFNELEALDEPFDYLFVDTGAGISRNVIYFNSAVQDVVVVATPEPTSITDAYAVMKVLGERRRGYRFRILANMVADEREGKAVFRRLSTVTERFLDVSLSYLGHVVQDSGMPASVRRQKAVSEAFPKSPATRCLRALADRLHRLPHDEFPAGHVQFFWRRLVAPGA